MSKRHNPSPMFARARIDAGELHAGHIGARIRWLEHDNARDMDIVITAEVRQIRHDGNDTIVTYGYGAERETRLDHTHPVILGPPPDYSDAALFSDIPLTEL